MLCDELQNEIVNQSLLSDRIDTGVVFGLMGLLLTIIVISYVQMQRKLVNTL